MNYRIRVANLHRFIVWCSIPAYAVLISSVFFWARLHMTKGFFNDSPLWVWHLAVLAFLLHSSFVFAKSRKVDTEQELYDIAIRALTRRAHSVSEIKKLLARRADSEPSPSRDSHSQGAGLSTANSLISLLSLVKPQLRNHSVCQVRHALRDFIPHTPKHLALLLWRRTACGRVRQIPVHQPRCKWPHRAAFLRVIRERNHHRKMLFQ